MKEDKIVVPFQNAESDSRLAFAEEVWYKCLERGEISGLTCRKFSERVHDFVPADDAPGKYVVSVERHRGIGGCFYRPGCPMSAFETYREQYLFDPESEEITDYGEVHMSYTFDSRELADDRMMEFRPGVEICGKGRIRRVTLDIINFEFKTTSLKKAKDAIENEIRDLCFDHSFEGLEMDPEELGEIISQVVDASVAIVLERLEEAWGNPEVMEDE